MPKKSTRGGKRAGSGRKLKPDKKVPASVAVTPETMEFLRTLKNVSKFTEAAIRATLAFRQWQKSRPPAE